MADNNTNVSIVALRYAEALLELGISGESIKETELIFSQTPQLWQVLSNPVVSHEEKYHIIDRVFSDNLICRFLKILCRHDDFSLLFEITESAKLMLLKKDKILKAHLTYVTPPTQKQLEKISCFICKKHDCRDVQWQMTQDPSLIGGFILYVDGVMYDRSLSGSFDRLKQDLTKRR